MTTDEQQKASQLPEPRGYKILCAVPKVDKTYAGGIAKADTTIQSEEHSTVVLFVMQMGEECYKDPERFKSPWCKEGDFVLVRAYTGTRFKVNGQEFRLINDDSVEAVVADPRGIQRA